MDSFFKPHGEFHSKKGLTLLFFYWIGLSGGAGSGAGVTMTML